VIAHEVSVQKSQLKPTPMWRGGLSLTVGDAPSTGALMLMLVSAVTLLTFFT